jgi:hypothetical protein
VDEAPEATGDGNRDEEHERHVVTIPLSCTSLPFERGRLSGPFALI